MLICCNLIQWCRRRAIRDKGDHFSRAWLRVSQDDTTEAVPQAHILAIDNDIRYYCLVKDLVSNF